MSDAGERLVSRLQELADACSAEERELLRTIMALAAAAGSTGDADGGDVDGFELSPPSPPAGPVPIPYPILDVGLHFGELARGATNQAEAFAKKRRLRDLQ